MKNRNYFQWLIFWLLFLVIDSDSIRTQCGTPATNGAATISSVDFIVNSNNPGTGNLIGSSESYLDFSSILKIADDVKYENPNL